MFQVMKASRVKKEIWFNARDDKEATTFAGRFGDVHTAADGEAGGYVLAVRLHHRFNDVLRELKRISGRALVAAVDGPGEGAAINEQVQA